MLLSWVTNALEVWREEVRLILFDARFRHSRRCDGSKEKDFIVSIPAILDCMTRRFDVSTGAPFA